MYVVEMLEWCYDRKNWGYKRNRWIGVCYCEEDRCKLMLNEQNER